MRTRILPLFLLALLLPFPSALAAAPSAQGPDANGAWTLSYDVDAVGAYRATLDVLREDPDGSRHGARDLGTMTFAGPERRSIAFLPAEGAGRYTVALKLDGEGVDQVVFDVSDASASSVVAFDVPDAPTTLTLTNDTVNAEGKVKSPGEALITRATISDANGLSELDGVAYVVLRAGVAVNGGAVAFNSTPNATTASLELRYDRSPLAAGDHTLTMRAMKGGQPVANVSRTFVIRDVPATFVSGALPDVTPDDHVTLHGTVVLADKNGAVGPGAPETRIYRGSTRVESQGFEATLRAPERLTDADGSARWSYTLDLRVPARAPAGAHRVSIYLNDSLLGAVPFDVRPLPMLHAVNATTVSGRLLLKANVTGEGILTATLSDGEGSSTSVSAATSAPNFTLDAPRRGAPLRWVVTLRAREGGPVLAEKNDTWMPPLNGPPLTLTPLHVRGRLPAIWGLDAGGWDMTDANASVTFTRWDGATESRLNASVSDGRIRVDAPRDLVAGRYQGRLLMSWANGSASEVAWSFEAGPWVEITLSEPLVQGRNATVALHNGGGLAISRLVVEVEAPARTSLRVGNATLTPTMTQDRAMFSGFSLAPGADAQVLVELPAGPLPSGQRTIHMRVLARVELG